MKFSGESTISVNIIIGSAIIYGISDQSEVLVSVSAKSQIAISVEYVSPLDLEDVNG